MAEINLFALGGQDENGKNLFVIEINNDIFVINVGIKFPINDKWGVDGIIADTAYLQKHQARIQGVFLTHAHDEVFAALPWLIMDIEELTIYGSPYTIAVAKNRIAKYRLGHHNYKFEVITEKQFRHATVRTFSVATSIPGALAYGLSTSDGMILFMAAAIIDDIGMFGRTDLEAMKKQAHGNVLALISDARRANYPKPAAENKSLVPLASQVFKKTSPNQRIICGMFDEEMFNIFEIIQLANKHQRPVAFYGSAFSMLYHLLPAHFKNDARPHQLVEYKHVNQIANVVVLVTGTWSRLNDRFKRIASNKDVYLKFKQSDAVIMYMPPVNGMEVEYARALDDIAMITPNITSIDDKMVFPLRQSKADIGTMVAMLNPRYFLPTSALFRYQSEATKMALARGVRNGHTIVLANGTIAYFKNGRLAAQKSKVKPYGDVIIQGYGVGDVSLEVIKERKKLSAGGLVTIASQYNKNTKQLVGAIDIHITGVVVKPEIKKYEVEIRKMVIQKFEQFEQFDYREIQNAICRKVQKIFFKKINKEPLVVMTFHEVE